MNSIAPNAPSTAHAPNCHHDGQAEKEVSADSLRPKNLTTGSSLKNRIANEKLNKTVSCFDPEMDCEPVERPVVYTQAGARMLIESLERTIKVKDEIIAIQAKRIKLLEGNRQVAA